jgi:hypothetical protein
MKFRKQVNVLISLIRVNIQVSERLIGIDLSANGRGGEDYIRLRVERRVGGLSGARCVTAHSFLAS